MRGWRDRKFCQNEQMSSVRFQLQAVQNLILSDNDMSLQSSKDSAKVAPRCLIKPENSYKTAWDIFFML